jgi:branched-chain amino acid transport system substrate-binding protein
MPGTRFDRWFAALLLAILAGCNADPGLEPAPQDRGDLARPGPPVMPTPTGQIRIAAIFPTAGRYEASGRECLRGVRMAVEALNRQSGVAGRRIFLVNYSTRSDVESTEEAARRAVTEGALALIGSNASLLSRGVAEVAEQSGTVMVSNVSTATDLTIHRPFVFRTCYSNDHLARLLARFVWSRLNGRRVAVLHEVSRPYSKDLARCFSTHFEELIAASDAPGAVRSWPYVAMESDFTPYLVEILRFKPDVLFLPSSFDDATLVAMHLRGLQSRLTMVGGDSWSNEKLFRRCAPPGPAYHSDHWNPARAESFVETYRARYDREPNGGRAALAYDAVWVVVEALKTLGVALADADLTGPNLAGTRRRLRDRLGQVRITGVSGDIRFDREGNAEKPCFVFQVDGRSRVLAATLK